jgi:hypothetical protein
VACCGLITGHKRPENGQEARLKKVLAILIGAGIGAAIGYSQIFCPGGQCALTGSWYGGAAVGGLLGMMFTGGHG